MIIANAYTSSLMAHPWKHQVASRLDISIQLAVNEEGSWEGEVHSPQVFGVGIVMGLSRMEKVCTWDMNATRAKGTLYG